MVEAFKKGPLRDPVRRLDDGFHQVPPRAAPLFLLAMSIAAPLFGGASGRHTVAIYASDGSAQTGFAIGRSMGLESRGT
jgi:hypothetical protein